jgi:hypothetical protein
VRQIVLEDLPRPYVTPEAVAARFRPVEVDEAAVDPQPRSQPRPLMRDVLVRLFADGVIHRRQLDAGQEIERVYRAITASVSPRVTAAYGERIARGGDGEDLPVSLRLAYSTRYVPWRTWAGGVAVTPARSLADLTMLVCVDGYTPRQLRPRLGLHEQTLKRRLQVSLHEYCRIAGWLVNDRP